MMTPTKAKNPKAYFQGMFCVGAIEVKLQAGSSVAAFLQYSSSHQTVTLCTYEEMH
jgi:hypothetical protein